MDDPFEKIAKEAIQKAERVDAPFEAFVAGLKTMADEILERWALARDEAESRGLEE
jgi:hypothetical protein